MTPQPNAEPPAIQSAIQSPPSLAVQFADSLPNIGHNRGRKTGPSDLSASAASSTATNNKRGTLGVKRLVTMVTQRDIDVLTSISELHFLSTTHLLSLHFYAHATESAGRRATNTVLARLVKLRLIRRLNRKVGGFGGGSGAFVWSLDVAGDRLLQFLAGNDARRGFRPAEPSATFFEHCLAVADVYAQMVTAGHQGNFVVHEIQAEPKSWRDYSGELGSARILKPDLAAVTHIDDFADHWFIEVDRGTEWSKQLTRQALAYEHYRRTGIEQEKFGVFPRVLWLAETVKRAEVISKALSKEKRLDQRMFLVTTTDRLINVLRTGESLDESAQPSTPHPNS